MRAFEENDIEEINGWYGARNMPKIPRFLFPKIGMIEPNVGAGFLYQTDSQLCFLDGYISNPLTSKEDRKSCFDDISARLIRIAKDHGFTHILAYTKNPGVKKMCDKFQFQLKGEYTLYIKEV